MKTAWIDLLVIHSSDKVLDLAFSKFSKLISKSPFFNSLIHSYLKEIEKDDDDDIGFEESNSDRLKDRAQMWLSLFYDSSIGIASADSKFKIEEFNPAFQKMLGYEPEELKCFPISEITHPEDRHDFVDGLDDLFHGRKSMFQSEKRCVRKDGAIIWTRCMITAAGTIGNRMQKLIAIIEDVTDKREAEEALRKSEERLKATVSYTSVGIANIALDGHFIDCNPAFASMIGYTRQECLKLHVKDITVPKFLSESLQGIERLVEGQTPFVRMNKKFRRKDGSELWVQSTLSLTRQVDGEPANIVAVAEDISQRMKFESVLKKHKKRLSLAIAVSKVGFYDWDVVTNRIELSQQLCKDLQCATRHLSIEEALAYVYPPDISELDNLMENGVFPSRPLRCEVRFVRKDKEIIWMELRGQMILNPEGCPVKIFGTTLDITERKRLDETLRQNEENLRIMEERVRIATEAAQVGIWDFDFESESLSLSNRAKAIFGFRKDEAVDLEQLKDCLLPEDKQKVLVGLENALDPLGSGSYQTNLRHTLPDGTVHWTMLRGQVLFTGNGPARKPSRFTGALLDISEQQKLQEDLKASKIAAEVANATKSEFLANMSHEIRTPLSAIIGFADLLEASEIKHPDQDEYLTIIRRNAHALMHIIDDILDLSKVEAGHLAIEILDVSLYQLIEEVLGIFQDKAKKKGIYLHHSIDASVPKLISSDPTRLRQILINLIGNAIKFTERGGVEVDVVALPGPAANRRISIKVKDSGIGLTEVQKSKLFQPFSQADTSTTRRFGGTGLGLFLSKRLANALRGDIQVLDCEPNRGCTFEFAFVAKEPTPKQEKARTKSSKEAEALCGTQLAGTRILLAEDAYDNQLLVSTILSESGANVEVANNGVEAVSKALEENFDVILMDLQMPKMDGYEATKVLRESGYRGPIVALTAHAMKEDRERTEVVGCNCHLTKPLNVEELLKTIRYYS